jgi:hypothetical protein
VTNDKTQGTMNVRGVVSLAESPIYLMTVDPRIKSLKDFGEGDRIAVSAIKITVQALRSGQLEVKNYAAILPYNYEMLAGNNARHALSVPLGAT